MAVRAELGSSPAYVVFYISTNTPNLAGVFAQIDKGEWQPVPSIWSVPLRPGQNRFCFHSRNTAGVIGRATEVLVDYDPSSNAMTAAINGGRPVVSPHQFIYEDYLHPELVSLREAYRLDEKLAAVGADWERLIPLRTWLKGLWIHGQPCVCLLGMLGSSSSEAGKGLNAFIVCITV